MLLIYAEFIKFALFCMFFLILSEKNFEYYIFFDKFATSLTLKMCKITLEVIKTRLKKSCSGRNLR